MKGTVQKWKVAGWHTAEIQPLFCFIIQVAYSPHPLHFIFPPKKAQTEIVCIMSGNIFSLRVILELTHFAFTKYMAALQLFWHILNFAVPFHQRC
jgi:hypothetical protein